MHLMGWRGTKARRQYRGRRLSWVALALLLMLATLPITPVAPVSAASVTDGFTPTQVASGLQGATCMAFAPDGRLFVCEQKGTIRVIRDDVLLSTPFAALTGMNTSGERGLLGIAFDPDFATSPYVYVHYTTNTINATLCPPPPTESPKPCPRNRISRLRANGDVAVPNSEEVVFELDPLGSSIAHNGGMIDFGPDGKLYLGVGDNFESEQSQSLATLHGKFLRLNKDGTIPSDNPFYTTLSGQHRAIWAYGLRNPYTFDFQPGSGRLFINDVGSVDNLAWEEIDEGVAGGNYGWPDTEGPTTDPRFVAPLYAYPHSGGNCAITGGAFYNPATATYPDEYLGQYFFIDYCGSWLRRLNPATKVVTSFAFGLSNPVDLKVSASGSVYVLSRGSYSVTTRGAVYKIVYTGLQPDSRAPKILAQPQDQSVGAGDPATFGVSVTGATPLGYQWQRNDVNIPNTNKPTYTLPAAAPADDGARFRVIVKNYAGSVRSEEARLTVTQNQPPSGIITLTGPSGNEFYRGGDTFQYAGTATDPEDGTLPVSAFTWRVDFHHAEHDHPFIAEFSGAKSGSFTIPVTGHTETNVWYRITLTVRDANGKTHTSFKDLRPRTSTFSVLTQPAGLRATVDGVPHTTPATITGVVGVERALGVVTPQAVGCVPHAFASWSDGGTASHTIRMPPTDTSYTATFTPSTTAQPPPGLCGEYFDTPTFSGASTTRIDSKVDFVWPGGPAPGIAQDTFSVRWTGFVQPSITGNYTFYTFSNDGARLWVDNKLVIDHWTSHWDAEKATQEAIPLMAGQKYDIKMEYYDNSSKGVVRLQWSARDSANNQVVPKQVVLSTNLTSR